MKLLRMAVLLAAFSAVSCTSTQVISSWKADQLPATDYKKILVMGIINEKDRTLRIDLENEVVAKLKAQGYNAVSALNEHGPKAFTKMEEDEIASNVKASGYDAVITTVLLDKTKDQNYRPGDVRYRPVGVYYNRFGRYYSTIYDRVYTPGYYTTSTNFFLESNMYDVVTGDLVYSVQGKAFDPSSSAVLSSDYAKTLVNDMKKNGLISRR